MADNPSSILLLRLQSTGSNTNSWGGYLNTALSTLEQADKGYQSLAVTGDATISWTNYSTGNTGQYAVVKLTGSPSGSATLTFPAYQNFLLVWNTTGQTVTIKCSGGVGVAVPTSRKALLFCDGTDYYSAVPTWTGDVTTLTNNGDLVSYTQMQTAIATAGLPATSGTILNSGTDPSAGYLSQKIAASGTGAATASFATANPGTPSEKSTLTVSVGTFALTQGADQTTSFAAASNTRYNLTKSGNVTVTLPAAPAVHDAIQIEVGGTSGIVTYALNGLKYYGSTTNPASVAEGVQTFIYHSASRGWIDQ